MHQMAHMPWCYMCSSTCTRLGCQHQTSLNLLCGAVLHSPPTLCGASDIRVSAVTAVLLCGCCGKVVQCFIAEQGLAGSHSGSFADASLHGVERSNAVDTCHCVGCMAPFWTLLRTELCGNVLDALMDIKHVDAVATGTTALLFTTSVALLRGVNNSI